MFLSKVWSYLRQEITFVKVTQRQQRIKKKKMGCRFNTGSNRMFAKE